MRWTSSGCIVSLMSNTNIIHSDFLATVENESRVVALVKAIELDTILAQDLVDELGEDEIAEINQRLDRFALRLRPTYAGLVAEGI